MEEVSFKSFFREIAEEQKLLWPLILPIIYFVGYVYTSSYYSTFGISIEHYSDFYDWIYYGLRVLILSLFFYLVSSLILNNYTIGYLFDWFGINKEKWLDVFYFAGIPILGMLIGLIFTSLDFQKRSDYNYMILFSITFSMRAINLSPEKIGQKRNYVLISLYFLVIILFLSFAVGKVEAMQVLGKIVNREVLVGLTSDKTISTSDLDYAFVGENREYIFIYSVNENNTLILKKDELEFLKFKPDLDLTIK